MRYEGVKDENGDGKIIVEGEIFGGRMMRRADAGMDLALKRERLRRQRDSRPTHLPLLLSSLAAQQFDSLTFGSAEPL